MVEDVVFLGKSEQDDVKLDEHLDEEQTEEDVPVVEVVVHEL